jgi:hypothetical protein
VLWKSTHAEARAAGGTVEVANNGSGFSRGIIKGAGVLNQQPNSPIITFYHCSAITFYFATAIMASKSPIHDDKPLTLLREKHNNADLVIIGGGIAGKITKWPTST